VSAPLHNAALLPPGIAGPAHPAAVPPAAPPSARPVDAPVAGPSFASVLERQTRGVTFSRHALQRLERRGIAVPEQTLARLSEGVDRAAGKGSRASAVFVDGTAFVVSVPNRTVVTAVDPAHMRAQVFTNIDSAVIA
jgi:flagellar operon protein